MCVCVCLCVCVCVNVCPEIYVQMCVCVCLCVNTRHIFLHTHTHTHPFACIFQDIYLHTHTHTHTFAYIFHITQYLLKEIAGDKCKNLKVQHPEKCYFRPKELLALVIEIFMNLAKHRCVCAILYCAATECVLLPL